MKTLAAISLALVLGLSPAAWAGLANDADGDGIPDVNDNCIEVINPGQCDDGNTAGVGNTCDMDYNQNGSVDSGDIQPFVDDFGSPGPGDANCNGSVDSADIQPFIDRFGQSPGPSCCD